MNPGAIITATERNIALSGGIVHADIQECIKRAALECGVTEEQARAVMRAHWAGMQG